jgi:hypothetical protein
MNIEILKLLAEITIIPFLGLISATITAVISGWVTFQFAKTLEAYKKTLSNNSAAINVSSKDTKETPQLENPQNEDSKNVHSDDILKILARGVTVFISIGVLIAGTIITFVIIRPFGTYFILNRINELLIIPPFQELYREIIQFFHINTLINISLVGVSLLGGLLLVVFFSMAIEMVAWIFNFNIDD